MISLLWSRTIHGTVACIDTGTITTTPMFCDGFWRGGWWARYERATGNVIWRRWHRRGSQLFALVGEVMIATTGKTSGVYGLSYATGRKLWSRLGDRFDLLLKLCEFLPCDNAGDGPSEIVNGLIFTNRGRMLDPSTGRIRSRHQIDYRWGPDNSCTKLVDGELWQKSPQRSRYSVGTEFPTAEIDQILAAERLVASTGSGMSIRGHGAYVYVIACAPPEPYLNEPTARISRPGPPGEPYQSIRPFSVPHVLLILRADDKTVVYREDLGQYYQSQIAWLGDTTFAIALQTTRQWYWTYRRDLRVYDISRLSGN